jgi:hypothetical protein
MHDAAAVVNDIYLSIPWAVEKVHENPQSFR